MEEIKLHNVIMEKREKLTVGGVKDIGIYNEEVVELSTVMGDMKIEGKKLHINKFNVEDGELKIEGEISAVIYEEIRENKGGFFSGLFR